MAAVVVVVVVVVVDDHDLHQISYMTASGEVDSLLSLHSKYCPTEAGLSKNLDETHQFGLLHGYL